MTHCVWCLPSIKYEEEVENQAERRDRAAASRETDSSSRPGRKRQQGQSWRAGAGESTVGFCSNLVTLVGGGEESSVFIFYFRFIPM